MKLEHTMIELTRVHDVSLCVGRHCTLHNRSDHSMRAFPQLWRSDRALMERTCPHGVGHPDPDEYDLDCNGRSVHGCDGCCYPQ
jgi:hypothetical protein